MTYSRLGGSITHITTSRALLLVGVVSLLSGCLFQNSPTLNAPASQQTASPAATTTTPSTSDAALGTIDPTTLDATLSSEFTDAQTLAQAWHSNAVLYAVTIEFPSDLAADRSTRVYVFGSSDTPSVWWTVAMNEVTGQRVRSLVAKEDYLSGSLTPIPLQYWKVNAITALQTAEKAGGKSFRATNPNSIITATLANQGPNGWLWWVVTYRGTGTNKLQVRIHPQTDDIYDEQGNLVQASGSTPTPSPSDTTSATTQ